MRLTPVDLFRFGNSPKIDRVRLFDPSSKAKDAIGFDFDPGTGVLETWVRGRLSGVSCRVEPGGPFKPKGSKKWWVLPAGTAYDDDLLYLYSPDGDHWYWSPARDMRLVDFQQALALLDASFR